MNNFPPFDVDYSISQSLRRSASGPCQSEGFHLLFELTELGPNSGPVGHYGLIKLETTKYLILVAGLRCYSSLARRSFQLYYYCSMVFIIRF